LIYQLRLYTVADGAMDAWLAEWSEVVVPLRRRFGFHVAGAWVSQEQNRFVWIIGHEDFQVRDADYYGSSDRAALDPDPARHLTSTETLIMSEVELPPEAT
jgi:hypothetical protein